MRIQFVTYKLVLIDLQVGDPVNFQGPINFKFSLCM